MKEGFIRPKEINHRFSEELGPALSSITRVNVNGYETRSRKYLEINGEKQFWHSVKGGVPVGKRGSYEILYNPDISAWLKMVPIGARNAESLENKLRNGVEIGREVLKKSGLTDHATRLRECSIKTEDGSSYGFTTPHIGPTEEFILQQIYSLKPDQSFLAKEFVEKIHATAFNLAARLYLECGIWTSDPNPGNVVVHFNRRGATVSLIDFVSWPNKKYNGELLEKTIKETGVFLEKNLNSLYKEFEIQARQNIIPFSRDMREVNEVFTLLLEQKKRELSKSKF